MPTPRLCGGVMRPVPAHASPSKLTRPVAPRSNPAMIRNSVDLPQPEGPKSAVIPCAGNACATARVKPGYSMRISTDRPVIA